MTEQNGPNLEQRLLQIGSLNKISDKINISESPAERSRHYQTLANILSEGNPQLYKEAYGDIRVSPEEAIRYAQEGSKTRAAEAEPLYQERKEKIIDTILSSIKETLKGVKNKAEAASILGFYLQGLEQTPKLDQVTANEYAQEESAEALGVSMNFSARGSINDYKDKHQSLHSRLYASTYLKDKEGDVNYKLDEKKLRDLMEDVNSAAVVYSNAQAIKVAKEKASVNYKAPKRNKPAVYAQA